MATNFGRPIELRYKLRVVSLRYKQILIDHYRGHRHVAALLLSKQDKYRDINVIVTLIFFFLSAR